LANYFGCGEISPNLVTLLRTANVKRTHFQSFFISNDFFHNFLSIEGDKLNLVARGTDGVGVG
jgi:hypothetical protein